MAARFSISDSDSLPTDDEQDSSPNPELPVLGIRSVFRSIEHEIARDHEVCSGCVGIREFLVLERSRGHYHRITLPALISNSDICWFCRFLCRVMAHFLDEDEFEDCQIQKHPIDIWNARGIWEEDLMITASLDCPAISHLLSLPPKYQLRQDSELAYHTSNPFFIREVYKLSKQESKAASIWQPCMAGVRITIDYQKDRKVRKLSKLISDSVQQHEAYFGMIRNLLALCEGGHELCMGSVTEEPPLPTDFTLIDTLNRVLVPYTDSKPYIALSYVWGDNCLERDWGYDEESIRLGELVQRIYKRKSLPVYLPQTIEDAICVTQEIRQRYLWVDLLCINQTETASRNDSISKMDAIFSRAFLTVCVLQGQSMFSGIPGVSQAHQGRHQILTETESVRCMASDLTNLGAVLCTGDWSQRGWTFQEGVLGGRRLCFDTSGVFLHCQEEILHDIVESFDTEQRIRTPFNSDQLQCLTLWISPEERAWDFSIYARMVMDYSPRALTFPADAHNAIAGVLSRMKRSMKMSFIGGLPEGDFFNALLWGYAYPEKIGRRRPQFPSWSWLGWEGSKSYEFWVFDRVNEIQSIRTQCAVYFDAVRIQSAASFTFTHAVRDGSNATLRIKTERALFQVLWPPEDGSSVHQTPCWQLVQSDGCPIPIESDFIGGELLSRSETPKNVTVLVDQKVSDQLSQSQSPQLEFVLLQQWTHNEISHAPEILVRDSGHGEDHYSISEIDPSLIDHVWLMAIASRGDDTYERLAVIQMPARFWKEANPEAVSVDIV